MSYEPPGRYGARTRSQFPYLRYVIAPILSNDPPFILYVGFEYWTDPDHPEEGFITWQSDGQPSYRMGAAAVGPDTGPDGAQVGQRRIPEEPMVRTSVLQCY